jgi:1-acyl-sn-glycerol-3-phosphate acyltransferase
VSQEVKSSSNGHGNLGPAAADSRDIRENGPAPGLLSRVLSTVSDQAAKRIPRADLDERDPDFIRERLPLMWLLASIWFRAEVRGLGNIPEEGGVLLVGNHSGGNMSPDTQVFSLAFHTYFGVERPFYQLAHNLVMTMPGLSMLRKFGTVAASPANARLALESGAALLVYPGGDYEVHRPSWESAKVDFNGRKGWIRLALDNDVPVVPLVSIGGQETALFLTRGQHLARAMRLDRFARLKVLPVSIGPPFGVNVLDLPGRLPLPAKITIEVLPPIDLRERFGARPDVDAVYEHVTDVMQDALDRLAEERTLPVIG